MIADRFDICFLSSDLFSGVAEGMGGCFPYCLLRAGFCSYWLRQYSNGIALKTNEEKKMKISSSWYAKVKLCIAVAMLTAVSSVQAGFVTVTNGNFELGAFMTSNFKGFDVAGQDVIAWQDLGGSNQDSGVEGSGAWWGTYNGSASAFMRQGDGAYNLTGHTIQAGEAYAIGFAAKSWNNGSSQWTASLFYDNPTNVIGSFVSATDGTWRLYKDTTAIAATAGSVGGALGIIFHNTGNAFANLDEVTIEIVPFSISVSPTGVSAETNLTISATIVDVESSFVSAELSLDGLVVATKNTSSGTTNTLSYAATGLSIGVHTGEVVVVGSPDSMTNSWTFEISQPPFDGLTVIGPTGASMNHSPTLSVRVLENFSIVGSAQMWIDGALITPVVIDRSLAPTTTISAATGALAEGVHTGIVTVAGSPDGSLSNQWTFTVVDDDTTQPITPVHHWAFDETGSSTNVPDLVGTADGTVIGTNFAWTGSAIDLGGQGTSADWNTTNTAGSYVDLPNGIISALGDVATFEVVFTRDTIRDWSRVWDFGTSNLGEDQSGAAASDIFLTSSVGGGGNVRMETSTAAPGYNNVVVTITDPAAYANDELMHVVVIYDAVKQRSLIYVNGILKDANVAIATSYPLSSIIDVNNWIGRAQYGDPMFDGKVDDMRIYTGVMTAAQVAARYAEVLSGGGPTVEPEITSISVAGGVVTLSWTAEDVGSYSIERKTALTAGSWTPVATGLPSGNFTTNVSASGASQEFYQIKGE